MLESTVLGVPIDNQSYIKTIIATHYDRSRTNSNSGQVVGARPWGQDSLAYLYSLFENEVPRDDYALANVPLQEYVSAVTNEHYEGKSGSSSKHASSSGSSSSKERRKSKRSSKDKSSRGKRSSSSASRNGEIDWKSIDTWTLTEGNIKSATGAAGTGKDRSTNGPDGDGMLPPIDLQSHGQYQQ